jgi:NitT/TauT family transport system substrate-binding protein
MANELEQITSIGYHLSSSPPRLRVLLFMQYRNILFYPHFHLANAYFKKLKLIIVSIGVIVVAGSVLLLLYTEYNITFNSPSAEESRPIRIACSEPWVGYVPIILAVDRFFKENNVKVELIQPENQTTTEESFLNGSVDGLCSIFTTTIFQNSEGVNSRLVWVLDYSGTGDVILGPKNMTVKDLKGKKIGVEGLNTYSHIFVLQTLAKAGLFEKDVQFVNIATQDMVKALNAKRIDAGHTFGPAKIAGMRGGYDILATAEDAPAIIADVLLFNSKVVETRPEAVEAVVKSINQGKEYFDRNREHAYVLLSDFYNMTTEEVQDGFEGIQVLGLEDNIKAMNRSSSNVRNFTTLYESGNIIANYLLEKGQIRQIPNFDDIIDPKFIYAISRNETIHDG